MRDMVELSKDLSKDVKNDVIEFQNLQQQLQFIAMQRQQMELQAAELEKVSEEVEKSDGLLYRFVGSVIVPKEKSALAADLKSEKESVTLRLGTFSKQEDKLKERYLSLRKKLESTLGKGA